MIGFQNDYLYQLTVEGNKKIQKEIDKRLEDNTLDYEAQMKLIQAKLLSPLFGDINGYGSKYGSPY